ncbi:hypothetical protein [Mumia zhuanghuii]|nr:hypothetical protein [Mumia zhuanghuii]
MVLARFDFLTQFSMLRVPEPFRDFTLLWPLESLEGQMPMFHVLPF